MKALNSYGFTIDSTKGKGSHYKLYSFDKKKTMTVPKSLESPYVRNQIAKFIEDQGIDLEEFKSNL
ncbi:MAG: type II toxin-antitoxin system HicA family toxin [Candidatus Peribacteraceae bacterium]|nr:type II toxin-antitoxin system HicA family toxin [Candidatus Peribacteraceae bacterium]MBP9850271.1 type II toxin-antitoxin system HicA family toxin [Candidatus Peribacteraceae bacterium]